MSNSIVESLICPTMGEFTLSLIQALLSTWWRLIGYHTGGAISEMKGTKSVRLNTVAKKRKQTTTAK